MRTLFFVSLALLCACPLDPNPGITDGSPGTTLSQTSTLTGDATEGHTGQVSDTDIQGSTGTPDTDDLPSTSTSATSTTDPTTSASWTTTAEPECADSPVLCGDTPCLDKNGDQICVPPQCDLLSCEDCPLSGMCGDAIGAGKVCVFDGAVPCASDILLFCKGLKAACETDPDCPDPGAPNCVAGLCIAACTEHEDCGPTSVCAQGGGCHDARTGAPVCKMVTNPLEPCTAPGLCFSDTDCAPGAPTCWDIVNGTPVQLGGEAGSCVATCATAEECGGAHICTSKGFCADEAMNPVCAG